MKNSCTLFLLALFAALLFACSFPNTSPPSKTALPQPSLVGGASTAAPRVLTDPIRDQGVLVTASGAKLDIESVADDGTTVNCVNAAGIASISDGSGAKSLSASSTSIIIGTRADGNPGAWAFSSNKIQCVIDADSGQLTSRLPESSEQNGTFRGSFGWVYYVMGVSQDGKIIIGYAENKKGISDGAIQIDP